jgi:hypothetical protein
MPDYETAPDVCPHGQISRRRLSPDEIRAFAALPRDIENDRRGILQLN